MGPRMALVTALAILAFAAPAYAQDDPPPALFESAPAENAGAVTPSDGGRNALLLGGAGLAVLGAAVLGVVALRRPRRPETPAPAAQGAPTARPAEPAPVAEAPAAPEAWR